MARKRIVIIGSNFAGFTAAVALKGLLRSAHDVTVISRFDQFVFHPSLIRLPFGARTAQQAAFPVRPTFAEQGIAFRDEGALKLDLAGHKVITPTTEERYDFLVIATGAKPNYGAVPGLGPRGYTQSIMTLAEAEQARGAFETFLKAPGPVVIGDVQDSSCRQPAYEFLLNMERVLDQRGLSSQVPLTHLTSGPKLAAEGLNVIANAAVAEISPRQIRLADGRTLPFAYSMLLPSFLGVDVVRACEKITDAAGFVRVNAFNQTDAHPEVFAAGAAVAAGPPEKSGWLAEKMGLRVAKNIAACISGEALACAEPPETVNLPASPIALDDGWIIPGAEAGWAQGAFERYFPVGGTPLS
ncbi:MAG: sqr [Myxococcaceae bacterium]|nr:sqr [Myxococcaceae bacterium]